MTPSAETLSASIVVVDDAPANLMLIANILEDAGYQVRVASSAQRALSLVRRQPPDLILLDVNLPDQDGYHVCRELKADATLKSVPVIFLSADDSADAKARAREAGGAEYLVKPFEAADVLARISGQLQSARSAREIARLQTEVSLWRSRALTLFAVSLDGLTPGTIFDRDFRIEGRISADAHAETARFRATRLANGDTVTIEVRLPDAVPDSGPPVDASVGSERRISETGVPYVVRQSS